MYDYDYRHHYNQRQEEIRHYRSSFENNPSQKITVFPETTISRESSAIPSSTETLLSNITTSLSSTTTTISIKSNYTPTTATGNNHNENTTTNQATATAASTQQQQYEGKGLSAGVIAGITIGTLLLLVIVSLILTAVIRHRRHRHLLTTTQQLPSMNNSLAFRRGEGGGGKEKINLTSTDFIQTPPATTIIHAINTDTDITTNNNPTTTTEAATTTTTSQLTTISQLPIPPPSIFTVTSCYTQTLDDELYIQIGDQIQILTKYDDGWCLGINLSRPGINDRGVFPLHCCSSMV